MVHSDLIIYIIMVILSSKMMNMKWRTFEFFKEKIFYIFFIFLKQHINNNKN